MLTLAAYPLLDTTEARYGEMSRIMVETGNWLFPQIDYGVPFWGKPPLSFWASAASIAEFGNTEFFLRLPHFLAAVLVVVLVWRLALAMQNTRGQALTAVAVLTTTIGFLIASGAVMTDMFLCLSMTLSVYGFWLGWNRESAQIYWFYIGLAIGLLAKGPIVVVLVAITIVPWVVWTHGPRAGAKEFFGRMRVMHGSTVVLLLVVPWYYLMERSNPGFLQYFIVGEHFQRFLDSGWRGDLYGSGHARMRGTIWVYWLIFAFPWSLVLLDACRRWLSGGRVLSNQFPRILFLLLWMSSPMLLFSLAGNILPAYVLPGLPAIGLLVAQVFDPVSSRIARYLLLVGPVLLLGLSVYLFHFGDERFSDRGLLDRGIGSPAPIYYLGERPYSAQYYSAGKARLTREYPDRERFYLVIADGEETGNIDRLCELRSFNRKRRMYYCRREENS